MSSDPQTQAADRIRCLADYDVNLNMGKEIGEGSFSLVYKAKEKDGDQREVAIKMCFKKQIVKEKRVASVHTEKQVLAKLSTKENQHPFIVSLYATFQDSLHLYFVLSYAKHGDLLHVMQKRPEKKFSLSDTIFYSAELLSALQHLHSHSIIHRDVKPENILVAENGHILLSDFGTCKDMSAPEPKQDELGSDAKKRRCSFVGTAQYVSPEVLTGGLVSPATDLWSFAVVVYQFLTGKHAFHDESEYLMYKRIQLLLFPYPDQFPADAKNMIDKILVIKPEDRLGADTNNGPEALRSHPFFNGVHWDSLKDQTPPTF